MADLTESEGKDVEQETLLCMAKDDSRVRVQPGAWHVQDLAAPTSRWRMPINSAAAVPPPRLCALDATATGTSTVERVPGPDLDRQSAQSRTARGYWRV